MSNECVRFYSYLLIVVITVNVPTTGKMKGFEMGASSQHEDNIYIYVEFGVQLEIDVFLGGWRGGRKYSIHAVLMAYR